jgi:hypothetical protein
MTKKKCCQLLDKIIFIYYLNNKDNLRLDINYYYRLLTYNTDWVLQLELIQDYNYISLLFEYNYKYIQAYFLKIKKELSAIKIKRWIIHHMYKPNGLLWNKILEILEKHCVQNIC